MWTSTSALGVRRRETATEAKCYDGVEFLPFLPPALRRYTRLPLRPALRSIALVMLQAQRPTLGSFILSSPATIRYSKDVRSPLPFGTNRAEVSKNLRGGDRQWKPNCTCARIAAARSMVWLFGTARRTRHCILRWIMVMWPATSTLNSRRSS